MVEICVVHLVWAPLGPRPLEHFLESYCAHPAGRAHRLLAVLKGFDDPAALAGARRRLSGVEHEELTADRGPLDLGTYREVVEQTADARAFLFCNSGSEVLADGWLAKLAGHLEAPGVGIVGATGSWESGFSPAPWFMKPLRVGRFPAFPNPHLRTNAFMLDRELALALRWPRVRRKSAAWRLEQGRASLTRQVIGRGLEALVVDRHGQAHSPGAWADSATFRAGGQTGLLVADNRTREWEQADPARRTFLSTIAWGAT